VLEETGSLNPPVVWQPVPGVSNNSLTTAAVPGRKFYRLRRP